MSDKPDRHSSKPGVRKKAGEGSRDAEQNDRTDATRLNRPAALEPRRDPIIANIRGKLERHTSSYETDPDDATSPEMVTRRTHKHLGQRKLSFTTALVAQDTVAPMSALTIAEEESKAIPLSPYDERQPENASPEFAGKFRGDLKFNTMLPRIDSITEPPTPSSEKEALILDDDAIAEPDVFLESKPIQDPKNTRAIAVISEVKLIPSSYSNLLLPESEQSRLERKGKWLKSGVKSAKKSSDVKRSSSERRTTEVISRSDQDISISQAKFTIKSLFSRSFAKLLSEKSTACKDLTAIKTPPGEKKSPTKPFSRFSRCSSIYRRSDEGPIDRHQNWDSVPLLESDSNSSSDEADTEVLAQEVIPNVTIHVAEHVDYYREERFEGPSSPYRWYVSDDVSDVDMDQEPEVKMVHSPSTETVVAIDYPLKRVVKPDPPIPDPPIAAASSSTGTSPSAHIPKLPKTPKERMSFFASFRSRMKITPPPRKNTIPFALMRKIWCSRRRKKFKFKPIRSFSGEDMLHLQSEPMANLSFDNREELPSTVYAYLVEPTAQTSRMELRSRSLNNLSNLLTGINKFDDSDNEASPMRIRRSNYISNSNPDFSDNRFTAGMKLVPGPTRHRNQFVRHNNRLRYTHSQNAHNHFFRLRLPDNFNLAKVIHKKMIKPKRLDQKNVIYLPAIGNITLRSALQNVLRETLNLDAYVFVPVGSKYMLDINTTDTGALAGKTIIVHGKKSKKNFFGKNTTQTKTTTHRGFFSKSTDDSNSRGRSHPGPLTPTSSQGRDEHKPNKLSAMFGGKGDLGKMEKLEMTLNRFGNTRIPLLPSFIPVSMTRYAYDALRQIQMIEIDAIIDMSRYNERQGARQRAIMELITTEASYIGHLRTAVELFYSGAHHLETVGILCGIDLKKIFSNVTDILNVNLFYWNHSLYPMMAEAIIREQGFNTQLLYEGIMMFPECFKPYEIFVYEHKKMQKYNRHMMEVNAIYTAYLAWCESQKQCMRLKLSDIMVKPMQRLTKYSLLLKAIYDLTDTEPELSTLSKMYKVVKKYIAEVNLSVRFTDECDATDEAIAAIESYDLFSMKDEDIEPEVKPYMELNLYYSIIGCDPRQRRFLILQGDLRMKEWNDTRLEFRAILFTDTFLTCVPTKNKKKSDYDATYRVVRQKYMIDKMRFYPKYVIKDGVEILASILIVVLDETGTVVTYFTIYESKIKENHAKSPNLKMWEFALMEAKVTMELARRYFLHPRRSLMDIDSDSVSDFEADKRFSDQALQPDKITRTVRKAAKERLITMIHGAEKMAIDTANTDESSMGLVSHNKSPYRSVSRARSRGSSAASHLSSLLQSHSGSYDMTEPAPGPSRRPGSVDTFVDNRTFSLSTEEWPPDGSDVSHHQNLRPRSPSQRLALRPPIGPVPTPNTLTVQPNQALQMGQSMPDLSSGEGSPSNFITIQIPQVSLDIPRDPNMVVYMKKGPPPSNMTDFRGTSYPPPSPTRNALRRGFAFSSQFKNPLVKSKQISREATLASPKVDKCVTISPSPSNICIEVPEIPLEAINEATINQSSTSYLIPPEMAGTSEKKEKPPNTEKRKP